MRTQSDRQAGVKIAEATGETRHLSRGTLRVRRSLHGILLTVRPSGSDRLTSALGSVLLELGRV